MLKKPPMTNWRLFLLKYVHTSIISLVFDAFILF